MTSASRSKGEDVASIAADLSASQRRLILALDDGWKYPRDIIPHGTASQMSHRDSRLVERMSEASDNPYRLTTLGLAVKAHLTDQEGQNR